MISSQPRKHKTDQHRTYSVPDTILHTLLNWIIQSLEQSYEVDTIITPVVQSRKLEALEGFITGTCSGSGASKHQGQNLEP